MDDFRGIISAIFFLGYSMLYPSRLFVLLVMFLLSACSYNPLSTTNRLTGDPVETAAGGIAGFGTAAAFGTKSPVVLGLAGIGGASIGYYMSTLRYDAAGIYRAGGQVYSVGDYLTIEIPSNRIFDDNTSDLTPMGNAALRSAAKVLNRLCCQSVLVSGNSSGFGTPRLERGITEDRARVVAAFLWAQGVNNFKKISNDTRRLTYVGYGNYFPIANHITNKGIRANSRIQITAYPTKDQLLMDQKKRAFTNIGETSDDNDPHLALIEEERTETYVDVIPERVV
jgi:outer membrane protein OmpA-like peptidoglycan-associated protein